MGLLDIFKKEEKSVVKKSDNTNIMAKSEAMLAEVQVDILSIDTVKLPI